VDFQDSAPRRITLAEWSTQFRQVPDELIQRYHYFAAAGNQPWATYLFPPLTYALYSSRHLTRLKFDNSLAALRMWGFVLTETERLFRAGQIGRRVVATMGDLGATPPLVLAAGNALPFYPDCIWWVPFMNESTVLLDSAARAGIGESACYSRATLGAFLKRSYFPDPVLCIGATGASCDDYSAVEQLVESLGFPMYWLEMPLRKRCQEEPEPALDADECDAKSVEQFVTAQFRDLHQHLQHVLGVEIGRVELQTSLRKVNRVRALVREIKQQVYSAPATVLPALEMMVIEFGSLHFYSDIEEWTAILEHIAETVNRRIAGRQYLGPADARRVVWVTPPADPLLLVYAEDQGLRVVGSEYLINQSQPELPIDDDPVRALALSLGQASLTGSSRFRARRVSEQARRYQAEGVIMSGILGGSHCALETSLIRDYLTAELDLPVLAFDVPAPAASIPGQLKTRIEAFVELLKTRPAPWGSGMAGASELKPEVRRP
jgi:benzoyl-CoA reductase/2-hydroxyglutaryl-CoA dehydratase subunit BcrC/BadD/HgdB